MVDIKTPSDWRSLLDTHWANILDIANRVGANLGKPEYQFQELTDLR